MRSCLLALLLGCAGGDAPSRVLTTEDMTFDAGIVAVNDRYIMTLYLASEGDDPVAVHAIALEDEADPTWELLPTWATDTVQDEMGEDAPGLVIPAGTPEDPSYAPVEVSFRPDAEGAFRTTLLVESDDNQRVEVDPATGYAVWKVFLRGAARSPCVQVYPLFHDFGTRAVGSYHTTTVTVANCGVVTLTVAAASLVGSGNFSFDSVFPLYVLPDGHADSLILSYIPDDEGTDAAELTLITNAPDGESTVDLEGEGEAGG